MKKSQSHIKIGILSTGGNGASSVLLSSAAGFTLPSGSRKKEGFLISLRQKPTIGEWDG